MTYRQTLREMAWGSYGVITTEMANASGIPSFALRQLAVRGALTRVGHGVYRMEEVPIEHLSEFAMAVALCGEGAMLTDTTVLAALDLAQINLMRIRVAVPRRMRVKLPVTVQAIRRAIPFEDRGNVNGIPSTTLKRAILDSIPLVMRDRLINATHQAKEQGLLLSNEYKEVMDRLKG